MEKSNLSNLNQRSSILLLKKLKLPQEPIGPKEASKASEESSIKQLFDWNRIKIPEEEVIYMPNNYFHKVYKYFGKPLEWTHNSKHLIKIGPRYYYYFIYYNTDALISLTICMYYSNFTKKYEILNKKIIYF